MVHKQENIPGSAWGGGVCLEGWCLAGVASARGGGVLPREVSACGGGVFVQGSVHPWTQKQTPIACWDTHPPAHCKLG